MGAVVGISMVKDEADVIEHTLRLMLDQVDSVLIADNGSIDGTLEVLRDLEARDERLMVVQDPEVGYYQSRKMSALAARAAQELDAEWVVPFDADERWYTPHAASIADLLQQHPQASIVTAALFDHVATGYDPDDPNPVTRIGWRRREPAPLPKVAVRPRPAVTIHQGNHGADHGERLDGLLVVRHFPYRSPEQFVRKARNGGAAYAATDLPEHQGAHWRDYAAIIAGSGEDAGRDIFRKWFHSAQPDRDSSLIYDPSP